MLHGDLTSFHFVFKVVYCPSWSFEVTRGQQIRWILGAVRGGRRKDGHGLVFAFPLWERGDILFKVRNWQHCSLLFSWAAGTKIDGFCHIDMLVCGPTSVSEKAEGGKLLF